MKDVVSIPLYLAIIVLNSIEVHLIVTKPAKKRLKSEKMLLSLSIGDILLGINGIIGFLKELGAIPSTRIMTVFLNSFIIFSVSFSILHILLLTMDRFISVYFPIRRRTLMSDNLIHACLLFAWIFSLVTSPLVVWHSIASKSHIYPVFLSIEVLPTLFVLLFVYIMIYRKLRGSAMFSSNRSEPGTASTNSNGPSTSYTVSSMEANSGKQRAASLQTYHVPPEIQASNEEGNLPRSNGSTSSYSNVELLSVTAVDLKVADDVIDEVPKNEGSPSNADAKLTSSNAGRNAVMGATILTIQDGQNPQNKPSALNETRRHSSQALKQEQRILILGISIIISFAICFLPATITFLVFLRFSKASLPYFVLAYFFAVLNSISNPILYFFYRYWDKIKRKCCCCCCK